MISEEFKKYKLKNKIYSCTANPFWQISRWDILDMNRNKKFVFIFGFNEKNNLNFNLKGLIKDTLCDYLRKDLNKFKNSFFRFELDGQKFNFCEKEPEWSKYDYGEIEE